MSCICFVTDELYPIKPGGAGSLIYHLANALMSEGHRVVFVLNFTPSEFERFLKDQGNKYRDQGLCKAYRVDDLCQEIPYREEDFISRYIWDSYRYDIACQQIYEIEHPDIFEFVDYCGPAYYALCSKIMRISYQVSRITVRIHGPIKIIDQVSRVQPLDYDRYTIYALEEACFRLAETILFATPSIINWFQIPELESWLGERVIAPPLVANPPTRYRMEDQPDVILFYGRISAEKGVERFIDAAVMLLNEFPENQLKFYLVGAIPELTPFPEYDNYQQYLQSKIPEALRNRFIFTGLWKRERLETLLPRVIFAVMPSYFETFGMAAQELRLAGVPLIVSDIPAFRDTLSPDIDALFFNGTTSNLRQQMQRFLDDQDLLARYSVPAQPSTADHLAFYRTLPEESWIQVTPSTLKVRIVVCIIEGPNAESNTALTLESVSNSLHHLQDIFVFKPFRPEKGSLAGISFLGKVYQVFNPSGEPIARTNILTKDALLILKSDDTIAPQYISMCIKILEQQPQVGYVGSWKQIKTDHGDYLFTHPTSAMLELAPFERLSNLSRFVFRTKPDMPLSDLFEAPAGELGEIAYLWCLEEAGQIGLHIPEPLIYSRVEHLQISNSSALSFLIQHDQDGIRKMKLARYLVVIASFYPKPLLPLQSIWAEEARIKPENRARTKVTIAPGMTSRERFVRKLKKGSTTSRKLLTAGSWLWSKRKYFRKTRR